VPRHSSKVDLERTARITLATVRLETEIEMWTDCEPEVQIKRRLSLDLNCTRKIVRISNVKPLIAN
jgi:hypothetical protein